MPETKAAAAHLLDIRALSVDFCPRGETEKPLLHDMSLFLDEGEIVALAGESGSGKSLTSLAIAGLLGPKLRARGSILLNGQEVIGAAESALNKRRGSDVAIVFQEPATALDPLMKIGRQIAQPLRKHGRLGGAALNAAIVALMREVRLSDIERIARSYPHEISGGQRQRAALALALACSPKLLIADEATSALDAEIQLQLITLIQDISINRRIAVLFITHDIAAAERIANRIIIMKEGRIIETIRCQALRSDTRTEYTKALIRCAGGGDAPFILEERQLRNTAAPSEYLIFDVANVFFRYRGTDVLRSLSMQVYKGESLGIIGESGSGKTTLLMLLLRLAKVRSGTVSFCGTAVHRMTRKEVALFRMKVQPVFQDPFLSLDPSQKIGHIIAEPIDSLEGPCSRAAKEARIINALHDVGLDEDAVRRYPAEFSGGQRQRIAIARALITNPEVLIADEPVSALDSITKYDILKLLHRLKQNQNWTLIMVSHDLPVIESIATRVITLKDGAVEKR